MIHDGDESRMDVIGMICSKLEVMRIGYWSRHIKR